MGQSVEPSREVPAFAGNTDEQRESEHTHLDACAESGAKVAAFGEIVFRDRLFCEDLCFRLRMRADDQRGLDLFEPPACGNAGCLTRRILAIRAGADHQAVGAALDLAEDGIVAAVEEFLRRV